MSVHQASCNLGSQTHPNYAQIYKNGKKENKDHILTKLPAEVQRMIFKALPSNADRAALGLTCKVQAEVYESLKEERSRKDFAQRPPVRVTRVHRLQMLVRLIPDMPRRYRLCYNCNQFIDLDDSDNNGQWGGSASFVKGGLATPAAMKKGPRCPLCVEADKLELAEHKPMFRKFLCLADSIQHCNEWQQAMD